MENMKSLLLLGQVPEWLQQVSPLMLAGAAIGVLFLLAFLLAMVAHGKLLFQAYMSSARISLLSLISMSLRQVDTKLIVQAKIMAMQSGLGADPRSGITTRRLEAHYLAGGRVLNVITAVIAAHRADI